MVVEPVLDVFGMQRLLEILAWVLPSPSSVHVVALVVTKAHRAMTTKVLGLFHPQEIGMHGSTNIPTLLVYFPQR